MAVERLSKCTLSVTELRWQDGGFSDPVANAMWRELPVELREIAQLEIEQGNIPWNILRNSERSIVLLAFRTPPHQPPAPNANVRVHRQYEYGNYCYDGTLCTYEHVQSGCFLAFDNPEWRVVV